MCEIFFLYSKTGSIDTTNFAALLHTAVNEASERNSDGFGIYNEEKQVFKSDEKLDYKHLDQVIKQFKDSQFIVLHLRLATQGSVVVKNSHPFKHKTNVLVHNGTVNTPRKYEKGRADSYQLLRDIYKRKDGDTVAAIQDSMSKTTGSVSVFLHDYKGDLYYFRERSNFTFAEVEGTDEIVGATVGSRLSSIFSPSRLQTFAPAEGEIFRVEDEVRKVAEFDTSYYSGGSDVVYSHGHGHRYRRPYWDDELVQESDYEKWKQKQEEEEEIEEWL
jgi:hypothetical protein